jgi:hypothetical protein
LSFTSITFYGKKLQGLCQRAEFKITIIKEIKTNWLLIQPRNISFAGAVKQQILDNPVLCIHEISPLWTAIVLFC